MAPHRLGGKSEQRKGPPGALAHVCCNWRICCELVVICAAPVFIAGGIYGGDRREQQLRELAAAGEHGSDCESGTASSCLGTLSRQIAMPERWLRSCEIVLGKPQHCTTAILLLPCHCSFSAGLAAAGVPSDPAPTDFVPQSKCEWCAWATWGREKQRAVQPRLHRAHGSCPKQLLFDQAVVERTS